MGSLWAFIGWFRQKHRKTHLLVFYTFEGILLTIKLYFIVQFWLILKIQTCGLNIHWFYFFQIVGNFLPLRTGRAVTYGTLTLNPCNRPLKTSIYLVFWAPDNYQQALLVSIGIYFQFLFVLPEINKNCPLRAGQNNDTTWYLVFNMVLKNE